LLKIGHRAVQEWVNDLSGTLAPASVAKCYGALSMILAAAVRERMIPLNPAEGVGLPSTHKPRRQAQALSRGDVLGRLLPSVPTEHRLIVALAAGAGLRWGECAGLPWSAVDLEGGRVHVRQVLVEVRGTRVVKPFPKSKAGVGTVPLPTFVVELLKARRDAIGDASKPAGLVFPGSTGDGLLRASFRRDVWRPALVRAGLLGSVVELGPDKWRARWRDTEGVEWTNEFMSERDAVAHLVERAGRATFSRFAPFVRYVACVAGAAGQRCAAGDGARGAVNDAQPVHARAERLRRVGPGRAGRCC
jgi:integrase